MQHLSHPSKTRIFLAFAAIYLIWGSTYLFIKFAVAHIPPLLMSGIRYTIAGIIALLIAAATGAGKPKKIHWKNTAIIGSLLFLAGNGAVSTAETIIPSGIAALIVCAVPIWFALFGWLFFKKGKPELRTTIGIITGIVGILVLSAPGTLLKTGLAINPIGVIIIGLGSMGWSIGSLFATQADLPSSTIQTAGMQMLSGGIMLLAGSGIKGEWSHFNVSDLTSMSVISVSYLIVFGSITAFSAYNYLIKNSKPSLVATYAYVNPVIAVFLGFIFNGEKIDRFTITGSLIIVFALILITFRKSIPVEEVPE